MSFVKLYGSIIHSSIWAEPNHVRIVWLTMLAMSTYQGVVEASVGGIAHAARVTVDECRNALDVLQSPDKDSRDGTTGERIRKVAGGWEIINHNRYRDMRSPRQVKQAEYQSRYRQRVSGAHSEQSENGEHHVVLTPSTSSSPSSSPSYSPSSEEGGGSSQSPVETSDGWGATTTPPPKRSRSSGAARARHEAVEHDPAFLAFWRAYDHKVDKVMAAKAWVRIAPSPDLAAEITKAAEAYAASKPDKQYRKHPTTWLNNRCWENDLSGVKDGSIPDHGFVNGKWMGVPRVIPKDYYKTGPVDEHGWPLNLNNP